MTPATLAKPHSKARTYSCLEIAEYFDISIRTVMIWIVEGELPAILSSRNPKSQKPRYRITEEAFEQFKLSRSSGAPTPTPTRRRKESTAGVKKFF